MASGLSNSITIARPVEDVFAVLTNVENTGKWFPAKVKGVVDLRAAAWRRLNPARAGLDGLVHHRE